MVIAGIDEGVETMIEVKSAAVYGHDDEIPEYLFTPAGADDTKDDNGGTEEQAVVGRPLTIDGSRAVLAENMLYRGQGMISANNSSRLLLDYKAENPDKYWEIMELLFGSDGLAMSHLKVEMGSDANTSSGTEPAVMRSESESADVTRGAAYQLAADAKSINPDLTLDMLWWSEPAWVTKSSDVYAARYKWYKETLDAAYNTYGLCFDYVGAVQNERAYDADWIKYLSSHLKSETDAPYDYSQIKIVAGDEVCTWNIASAMMDDEELRDAVDVIGSHYTSWASDNAKTLAEEYGKELWFSEASPSMSYSKSNYRYDGNNSGLSGVGGALDVANRIITMIPGGYMTLYEYQPAVAAYYDGVTYGSKQLIKANEPWSGAYSLDSGFYTALHFSQFIKKGWAFVDGACLADGKAGGDGHAIVDADYSYITLTDPETGDYSTVITNTTDSPITYDVEVTDLAKAGETVYVWETRGPDGGSYDENYFRKTGETAPAEKDGKYTYSVTLQPYSIVTLTTLDISERSFSDSESALLELPYSDDYEYADYPSDYLSSRGNAPRYTTDEGGAFEVTNVGGTGVLMQQITDENRPDDWGYTPNPVTNFGDDRWFNYSVSADILLENTGSDKNYAGIGLRYSLGGNSNSGYWAKLYEDGTIDLMKNGSKLDSAEVADFDKSAWNNVKVEAVWNIVKVCVNDKCLIGYECTDSSLIGAGRAAFYSAYHKNCFDNFKAEQADSGSGSVERYDNMDSIVSYSGQWEHTTVGSWKSTNRTSSKGQAGASVSFGFEGTGFAVTGDNAKGTVLEVSVDGKVTESGFETFGSEAHEISCYVNGLDEGHHDVTIRVVSGTYNIDGIEISGGNAVSDPKDEKTDESEKTPSNTNGGSSSDKTNGATPEQAAAALAGAVMVSVKKKDHR